MEREVGIFLSTNCLCFNSCISNIIYLFYTWCSYCTVAEMNYLFSSITFILTFVIPILTMRIMSEDKKWNSSLLSPAVISNCYRKIPWFFYSIFSNVCINFLSLIFIRSQSVRNPQTNRWIYCFPSNRSLLCCN